MDGGWVMPKAKHVIIDTESSDFTGYTVSLPNSMTTGHLGFEDIDIIQGTPRYMVKIVKEQKDNIFPESREEEFLDDKLAQFYKKKGYPLKP